MKGRPSDLTALSQFNPAYPGLYLAKARRILRRNRRLLKDEKGCPLHVHQERAKCLSCRPNASRFTGQIPNLLCHLTKDERSTPAVNVAGVFLRMRKMLIGEVQILLPIIFRYIMLTCPQVIAYEIADGTLRQRHFFYAYSS